MSVDTSLFFIGDRIIVCSKTLDPLLPFQTTVEALNLKILSYHQNNDLLIVNCDSATEVVLHEDYQTRVVKYFLAEVGSHLQSIILRGFHSLNWFEQSKFCGRCGSPLQNELGSVEKKCINCKTSVFPRFSPAVMVLIRKDDKILLARSPHFPPGIYSAVAGFVELGESAEDAAHREVKEEMGIEITDLTYFATQAWPFPDSFMIAFKANYLSGELQPDPSEIEEARWYGVDDIPQMPPSASVARRIIESTLADIQNKSKKE